MPFKRQCVNVSNHADWKCLDDAPISNRYVPWPIQDKILEIAGKQRKDFHKCPPGFCDSCLEKVVELYPDIVKEKLITSEELEHSYVRPAKVCKLEATRAEVYTTECQTYNLIIDLDYIQLDDVSDHYKSKLAYALGRSQQQILKRHTLALAWDKSFDTLLDSNLEDCVKSSNDVVLAFLNGLYGQTFDRSVANQANESSDEHATQNKNLAYQLSKTVESILNLTAPHALLPIHFRESILLYTVTGSRLALQILGAGGAHASYQAVKSWLQNLAVENTQFPDGNCVIAFDNNQILQRRWLVKLNNQVRCSVVTVVVCFNLDSNGQIQYNADHQPGNWRFRKLSVEEEQYVKFIDKDKTVKDLHYKHLYAYLQTEIDIVASQQREEQGTFYDAVDINVTNQVNASLYKKCYNCDFTEIPKKNHKCPKCKVNVTKTKMQSLGIDNIGNPLEGVEPVPKPPREMRVVVGRKTEEDNVYTITYEEQGKEDGQSIYAPFAQSFDIPTVTVHEPVYVNPCSYDATGTVLRNIGHRAGIRRYGRYGGQRDWVIIVCDGVPYNLCRRLISSMHQCETCKESFNGMDALSEHANMDHGGEIAASPEFDWVLLQPGPGHIEINMVKGLVELGWDVFWKELAILMNFRSEAALHCAKKVSDHHKGWTMSRIARLAITRELIIPFVRKQLQSRDQCTVSAFLKYTMKAADPNYSFMADFVLELMDALFMYRCGQRCCNSEVMMAARGKFAKLWSGRVHPLYRELEMADTTMFVRMPKDVQEAVKKSMSLNLSGRPFTGEGADFRLEEINKQVQYWLPAIPSPKDWHAACTNYDRLILFRERTFSQQGVSDPKTYGQRSSQDITHEVMAFRTKLRSSGYLLSPDIVKEHKSLCGQELDPDLKDFCKSSRNKRALYFDCYMQHEQLACMEKASPPPFTQYPVFITPADREKYTAIENLTIAELTVLVKETLEHVQDDEMKEELTRTWDAEVMHKKRRVNKVTYVEFYLDLLDYLQNQEYDANQTLPTDDE